MYTTHPPLPATSLISASSIGIASTPLVVIIAAARVDPCFTIRQGASRALF